MRWRFFLRGSVVAVRARTNRGSPVVDDPPPLLRVGRRRPRLPDRLASRAHAGVRRDRVRLERRPGDVHGGARPRLAVGGQASGCLGPGPASRVRRARARHRGLRLAHPAAPEPDDTAPGSGLARGGERALRSVRPAQARGDRRADPSRHHSDGRHASGPGSIRGTVEQVPGGQRGRLVCRQHLRGGPGHASLGVRTASDAGNEANPRDHRVRERGDRFGGVGAREPRARAQRDGSGTAARRRGAQATVPPAHAGADLRGFGIRRDGDRGRLDPRPGAYPRQLRLRVRRDADGVPPRPRGRGGGGRARDRPAPRQPRRGAVRRALARCGCDGRDRPRAAVASQGVRRDLFPVQAEPGWLAARRGRARARRHVPGDVRARLGLPARARDPGSGPQRHGGSRAGVRREHIRNDRRRADRRLRGDPAPGRLRLLGHHRGGAGPLGTRRRRGPRRGVPESRPRCRGARGSRDGRQRRGPAELGPPADEQRRLHEDPGHRPEGRVEGVPRPRENRQSGRLREGRSDGERLRRHPAVPGQPVPDGICRCSSTRIRRTF